MGGSVEAATVERPEKENKRDWGIEPLILREGLQTLWDDKEQERAEHKYSLEEVDDEWGKEQHLVRVSTDDHEEQGEEEPSPAQGWQLSEV